MEEAEDVEWSLLLSQLDAHVSNLKLLLAEGLIARKSMDLYRFNELASEWSSAVSVFTAALKTAETIQDQFQPSPSNVCGATMQTVYDVDAGLLTQVWMTTPTRSAEKSRRAIPKSPVSVFDRDKGNRNRRIPKYGSVFMNSNFEHAFQPDHTTRGTVDHRASMSWETRMCSRRLESQTPGSLAVQSAITDKRDAYAESMIARSIPEKYGDTVKEPSTKSTYAVDNGIAMPTDKTYSLFPASIFELPCNRTAQRNFIDGASKDLLKRTIPVGEGTARKNGSRPFRSKERLGTTADRIGGKSLLTRERTIPCASDEAGDIAEEELIKNVADMVNVVQGSKMNIPANEMSTTKANAANEKKSKNGIITTKKQESDLAKDAQFLSFVERLMSGLPMEDPKRVSLKASAFRSNSPSDPLGLVRPLPNITSSAVETSTVNQPPPSVNSAGVSNKSARKRAAVYQREQAECLKPPGQQFEVNSFHFPYRSSAISPVDLGAEKLKERSFGKQQTKRDEPEYILIDSSDNELPPNVTNGSERQEMPPAMPVVEHACTQILIEEKRENEAANSSSSSPEWHSLHQTQESVSSIVRDTRSLPTPVPAISKTAVIQSENCYSFDPSNADAHVPDSDANSSYEDNGVLVPQSDDDSDCKAGNVVRIVESSTDGFFKKRRRLSGKTPQTSSEQRADCLGHGLARAVARNNNQGGKKKYSGRTPMLDMELEEAFALVRQDEIRSSEREPLKVDLRESKTTLHLGNHPVIMPFSAQTRSLSKRKVKRMNSQFSTVLICKDSESVLNSKKSNTNSVPRSISDELHRQSTSPNDSECDIPDFGQLDKTEEISEAKAAACDRDRRNQKADDLTRQQRVANKKRTSNSRHSNRSRAKKGQNVVTFRGPGTEEGVIASWDECKTLQNARTALSTYQKYLRMLSKQESAKSPDFCGQIAETGGFARDSVVGFLRRRRSEDLTQLFSTSVSRKTALCPQCNIVDLSGLLDARAMGGLAFRARTGQGLSNTVSSRSVAKSLYRHCGAFNKGSSDVVDVKFAMVGQRPKLAVGCCTDSVYNNSGNILLADIESGNVKELEGHTDDQGLFATVTETLFSSDGECVFSSSFDKTVKVWSARTGDLRTSVVHDSKVIRIAAHRFDTYTVASVCDQGPVQLFRYNDEDNSYTKHVLAAHLSLQTRVRELAFGYKKNSHSLLAACGFANRGSGSLHIYDIHTERVFRFNDSVFKGDVSCMHISQSDEYIIVGSSQGCTIPRGYQIVHGQLIKHQSSPQKTIGQMIDMRSPGKDTVRESESNMSLSEQSIYDETGIGDRLLKVLRWEAAGIQTLMEFDTGQADHNVVSMSLCETYVTSSGTDNATFVFDLRWNRDPVHVLKHDPPRPGIIAHDGVNGAQWAMGRMLYTGGADGLVRIWDPHLGDPLVSTMGGIDCADPVSSLAVSEDGVYIASGLASGRVELFSLASGLKDVWKA